MQKIAISGLNNTDNPAPGIGVAKSLKDEFEIIGLSYDPTEPGNYLDVISKSYLMPYPSLGIDELLTRLREIKTKENIMMIIPCLDLELPLYIKYQKEIQLLGIKVLLPTQENFELRNKNKLSKLALDFGVEHPETYELFSLDELEKMTSKLSYPLMIKGNYHHAYKVNNDEDAKEKAYKVLQEWGQPILVQELILGEELNFIGLGDGEGSLTGGMSIKKLSTTEIGKIWTGVSIKHDKLRQFAEDFVKKTGWKGAFELECISHEGKLYLIEINPRFPSWTYFATAMGINLPKQLVQMAEGLSVKSQFEYDTGKMYVRFVDEVIRDFSDFSTLMIKKEL